MKRLLFCAALCSIVFTTTFAQQHKARWYPWNIRIAPRVPTEYIDSTKYFGPSIAVNLFQRETATKEYTVGLVTGVGYGFKWNPFQWDNSYLIGVDVFAQAGVTEYPDAGDKYFVIGITPVITVLNWIHVGYGPRWKIGLNDTKNVNTGVFMIGISKTL